MSRAMISWCANNMLAKYAATVQVAVKMKTTAPYTISLKVQNFFSENEIGL